MNPSRFHLLCMTLLVASVAVGQTPTGAAKPRTESSPTSSSQSAAPNNASSPQKTEGPGSLLPPETPVLTINGICDVAPTGTTKTPVRTGAPKAGATSASASSSAAANCKTQVTRAQFEKIMKTVAPSASPSNRRQIANSYVQLLTAANEGVKMGLDKDPDFPEQLALMRLQILANDAVRKLRTEASTVSDADAKSYYDQNPSAFEEVTLTRVFVPRNVPQSTPGQQQPAADSEGIAKSAREQLAAGGDPEKIEKTVYEQLKTTSEPPTTKFGSRRRGTLPPAHEQKVFAAKAGDVTDVLPDSVGYIIYRVDSKEQLPFDQVKDDAKRRITQQRLQDLQQQLTTASKADFNDAYFGPETPAAVPGAGIGPGAARGNPPASPAPARAPNGAPAAATPPQPQQSQPTTPKQ